MLNNCFTQNKNRKAMEDHRHIETQERLCDTKKLPANNSSVPHVHTLLTLDPVQIRTYCRRTPDYWTGKSCTTQKGIYCRGVSYMSTRCSGWVHSKCSGLVVVRLPRLTVLPLLSITKKYTLQAIHISFDNTETDNMTDNRVLNNRPPPINSEETHLSRRQRKILSQLRSGHCKLPNVYTRRLKHTDSSSCPDWGIDPQDVPDLFNCTAHLNDLSPVNLWDKPVKLSGPWKLGLTYEDGWNAHTTTTPCTSQLFKLS